MKYLLVNLAILLLTKSAMTTAVGSQQQVLNRYLGNWRSDITLNSSLLVPETRQLSETHNVQWVLDGHILQELTSQGDKETALTLKRYNQQRTEFEMWSIQSSGESSYWIGNWKKKSKTLTWEYVDFGTGVAGELVEHFTAEKERSSTLVMKDKKGKLLLDIKVKHILLPSY